MLPALIVLNPRTTNKDSLKVKMGKAQSPLDKSIEIYYQKLNKGGTG
jgi:hypothetical protein